MLGAKAFYPENSPKSQIHTFKGDSKLSTWLCTIAKNLYFAEEKKAVSDYHLETIPSTRDIDRSYPIPSAKRTAIITVTGN